MLTREQCEQAARVITDLSGAYNGNESPLFDNSYNDPPGGGNWEWSGNYPPGCFVHAGQILNEPLASGNMAGATGYRYVYWSEKHFVNDALWANVNNQVRNVCSSVCPPRAPPAPPLLPPAPPPPFSPDGSPPYVLTASKGEWSEVFTMCLDMGGWLYTPRNAAEASQMTSVMLAGSATVAWVGASDAAEEGRWITQMGDHVLDHTDEVDTPWQAGEPGNSANSLDCAHLTTQAQIRPRACSQSKYGLCSGVNT